MISIVILRRPLADKQSSAFSAVAAAAAAAAIVGNDFRNHSHSSSRSSSRHRHICSSLSLNQCDFMQLLQYMSFLCARYQTFMCSYMNSLDYAELLDLLELRNCMAFCYSSNEVHEPYVLKTV